MTTTPLQQAVRALALGTALAAPFAAQAQLSLNLPVNFLQADAVQAFSTTALKSFKAVDITVSPRGNAFAVPDVVGAYDLPVTSIQLQFIKVSGGSSIGSALQFDRVDDDDVAHRLTLANFTINFNTNQVLADATPMGGPTAAKTPIFNFNNAVPLGFKYQFPLTITGHQVLDKLFLTPEAKTAFTNGLNLPVFTKPILDSTDFGTITIDLAVKFRSQPVSSKPYVAN